MQPSEEETSLDHNHSELPGRAASDQLCWAQSGWPRELGWAILCSENSIKKRAEKNSTKKKKINKLSKCGLCCSTARVLDLMASASWWFDSAGGNNVRDHKRCGQSQTGRMEVFCTRAARSRRCTCRRQHVGRLLRQHSFSSNSSRIPTPLVHLTSPARPHHFGHRWHTAGI